MSDAPMKLSELVALGLIAEEEHSAKVIAGIPAARSAASKRAHGQDVPVPSLGNSSDVAARAVGLSEGTFRRARAVVLAAKEDPAKFGDLVERMDKTGRVFGVYTEMRRRTRSPKPRHLAVKYLHSRRFNREMDKAVWHLAGVCDVLSKIVPEVLDPARRAEWARELTKHARIINGVSRRVNVTNSEANEQQLVQDGGAPGPEHRPGGSAETDAGVGEGARPEVRR